MRPRGLNFGQRVVAIISLAGVFRVVGGHIVTRNAAEGGWINYVPLSEVPFSTGWSLGATLVWVLLIAAWGGFSIWLLGLPYSPTGRGSDTEGPP
ncbi:MAG: hypothetical protein M3203_01210 [Actinomycetota bacterium]|nr:hypothetical protein [Actinomycetota bacterium]